MGRATRESPEVRERAVRMVFKHRGEHGAPWAAIQSIAAKIGCEAETLRLWVRRHERDHGLRPGVTTAEQDRIKRLERPGQREAAHDQRVVCLRQLDRRFKP